MAKEFDGLIRIDALIDSLPGVEYVKQFTEDVKSAKETLSGCYDNIEDFIKGFNELLDFIIPKSVEEAIINIAALTIGIIKLDGEIKRQRIASHFGEISISLEDISDLTAPITGDIDKIARAFQENDNQIRTARDNFTELSAAIESTASALGKGDRSELDKFIGQVDEYVSAALSLTDSTNDTSALRRLYLEDGVIDEAEQSMLDRISELNESIKGKIEIIREQIHSITDAAIKENRDLTQAEIDNIKLLYDELAAATAAQSDVEQTAVWEKLETRAYSYESYDELLGAITEAREQFNTALTEAENAAYRQLGAQIVEARADGKSEEYIQILRDDWEKTTDKSFNGKKRQSLEYELKVLNAFGKAHYYDIFESEGFEKLLNDKFDNDEDRERFKQYYELVKEAQASGSDVDISSLATAIGDDYYVKVLSDAISIIEKDRTYGQWGTEHERVVKELSELGYDGTSGYVSTIEDLIKSSNTIDGAALLADAEKFTDKGKSDGEAYINALSEYISGAEIPWKCDAYLAETEKELEISIKPTPADLGDTFGFVIDNSEKKQTYGGISGLEKLTGQDILEIQKNIAGDYAKQQYPSQSSYAQPPSAAAAGAVLGAMINIRMNVDGVDKGTQIFKTNGSSTVTANWNDTTMNNGQGR